MRYLKVLWQHHDDEEQPTTLYSEIDSSGYEVRKIELYSDGRLGFADSETSQGGSVLGEVPVPGNDEIEALGPFQVEDIKEAEFSAIWAVARRVAAHQGDPEPAARIRRPAGNFRIWMKGNRPKGGFPASLGLKSVNLDIIPKAGKWVVIDSGDVTGMVAEASAAKEAVAISKALISPVGGKLKLHMKKGVRVEIVMKKKDSASKSPTKRKPTRQG